MKPFDVGITALFDADAQLTALAPGRTHKGLAPESTEGIFLSFEWKKPLENPTWGTDNGYLDAPVVVKAVHESSDQSGAYDAWDRADALLMGRVGNGLVIDGWTVMGVTREERVSYPEFEKGRRYQHEGAIYRILAQRA